MTGDFNECIGQELDGMKKVIDECHLVDIMTCCHPGEKLPNTYARGHRCLDYAFATEAVARAVKGAGYEPFNSHFPTDHRPYFIDLSIPDLFGLTLQPLAKYEPRVLQATNIHQVTAYIEKKYELLCEHNVFERAHRLSLPGNRHRYAERLDKDDELLPTSLRECSSLLRSTKKEIREIILQSFQRREQERQQLIASLMSSGKPKDHEQATRLRNLQKSEAIKQLFRKLKALRLVRQKSGVTCIEIPSQPTDDPNTCTEWMQIDLPNEVVFYLNERN